jgi:hypothetical protein
MNFGLENMIEAFFAQFLRCFWSLSSVLRLLKKIPLEWAGERCIARKQLWAWPLELLKVLSPLPTVLLSLSPSMIFSPKTLSETF